ncbi:TPA: hypothetical protein ACH3X1_013132 [Trebouxia sp. C0004]
MEGVERLVRPRAAGIKALCCASIATGPIEITMGTTGAHGDIRLPNVAVHLEGQQRHVRFLDFDWAGVAKEHTYPPFMNTDITLPPGAHVNAVMMSEHDTALLQMQLDLALQ